MFRTLSFRELIARLQAEQDARAQQIVNEGSQRTLTIISGDDVSTRELTTVTPDGNGGTIVEGPQADLVQVGDIGEVPENITTVTQNPDGTITTVGPQADQVVVNNNEAPAVAEAPVVEAPAPAPVVEPAPVAQEDAPRELTTVRPDGNGGTIVEGPQADQVQVGDIGEIPDNITTVTQNPDGTITAVGPQADQVVVNGGNAPVIVEAPEVEEPAPVAGEVLNGGAGRDRLRGTEGDDVINGGAGRDRLQGEDGNDVLAGGTDRDLLTGGFGNDTFVFNEGDGNDVILDFDRVGGDDQIQLGVDGVDSLDDVLASIVSVRDAGDNVQVRLDFGDGDRLTIVTESVESLTQDDFLFV